MTLNPRFAEAFRHLHPHADMHDDIVVQDDGMGPYLARWNLSGDPPSDAQIEQALIELDAAAALEPVVGYGEFRARWQGAELQALFAAEQADWRVRDLVNLAAAQGEINLTAATATAAKALFIALGVLTAARADEIFSPDR
jgi:hypothetical protein